MCGMSSVSSEISGFWPDLARSLHEKSNSDAHEKSTACCAHEATPGLASGLFLDDPSLVYWIVSVSGSRDVSVTGDEI
jgi:hypothetical protein